MSEIYKIEPLSIAQSGESEKERWEKKGEKKTSSLMPSSVKWKLFNKWSEMQSSWVVKHLRVIWEKSTVGSLNNFYFFYFLHIKFKHIKFEIKTNIILFFK